MSSPVRVVGVLFIRRDQSRDELIKLKNKKTKKRLWTRQWILKRNTAEKPFFKNHLKTKEKKFLYRVQKKSPYIEKKNIKMREPPLPAKLKPKVVLRFSAVGDSVASLSAQENVIKVIYDIFYI